MPSPRTDDHERLEGIRSLLARLESAPSETITETLKIKIAEAWRIIEDAEQCDTAPWTIHVLDPETATTWYIGIGSQPNHGFDVDRGTATLQYACHRAALMIHADVPTDSLYDRVHETRRDLTVSDLDRTNFDTDDKWYVVLDPGRINGRPRLPKTVTVHSDSRDNAVILAQWKTAQAEKPGALHPSQFSQRITELNETWRLDDAGVILPTIYEMAKAIDDLKMTIPKTKAGRQLERMLKNTLAASVAEKPRMDRFAR